MNDISPEAIKQDIIHLLTLKTMIARIFALCFLTLVMGGCSEAPQPTAPTGTPPPSTELCPGTNGRTFC